jgi:Uma2 family endonuclease
VRRQRAGLHTDEDLRRAGPRDRDSVAVESPRRRNAKRGRYALAGVREYRLVDPDSRSVEQLVLRDGRFESTGTFRDAITASVCDARIDLTRIW